MILKNKHDNIQRYRSTKSIMKQTKGEGDLQSRLTVISTKKRKRDICKNLKSLNLQKLRFMPKKF